MADVAADRLLRIDATPPSTRAWAADVWHHRYLAVALARKDFAIRYKRASFGLLWSVLLPVLQGAVLALVFSKVARFGAEGVGYGAFVLSGIVPWSFFSTTISTSVAAITDGASLADKVWFPRAALVTAPLLAGAVGFVTSLVVLLVLAPFIDGELGAPVLLVLPATMLLLGLTLGASLCVAALHVYFRDTKFVVQASLLVLIYLSPVIFDPAQVLPGAKGWFDLNPLTGILVLFHAAIGSQGTALVRPVAVTVVATIALLVIAVQVHRRHDRRFIDLL